VKSLAILTNGGDTCALNASIRSIRDNAYKAGYKKIYGIRRGYQGLVDGWIDDITDTQIDPRIGGSCLGSLRISPTDKCSEEERKETGERYKINEERCIKMAECLSDFRIDVLVVIGGDGTLQATKKFQDWVDQQRAAKRFRPFEIIGFLKTIDNDIRTFTNFQGIEVSLCPGFPSAVKKIVSCVEALRVTTRTAERAFSIETMGRDAGWLAAAATFGGAEILLVPEHMDIYRKAVLEANASTEVVSNRVISDLVDEIAHFYEKNRNVLIAVAEGFEPKIDIENLKKFTEIIRNLYGERKKVGATELITMLVRPVLEHYFHCLSYICAHKNDAADLSEMMEKAIGRAGREVSESYEEYKKSESHPLKDWDAKERLGRALRVGETTESRTQSLEGDSQPAQSMESRTQSLEGNSQPAQSEVGPSEESHRTPCSKPPYKFEIRPHRTDYVPRSGPPSSYDYKLATVLGRKLGEMLLPENSEFGAVPALKDVVPYSKLTLDAMRVTQIDEIRTLNFGSLDYFKTDCYLQVSERITDFFRTIMSGPEDIEEAIIETNTLI